MNLLFVSNHYPPEVNAPANRLAEHARVWAEDGHRVEVLTAVPNFPEGMVYEGYRNRWTVDAEAEATTIHRVPVHLAPNRGVARRGAAYASFMLSALWHAPRIRSAVDVVVATSPQLLTGVVGWRVARRRRVPFVLEVRDLWPDSVVAVGALSEGPVIRLLRRLERVLYRKADHIVVVTDAFVEALVAKGVPREKIAVVQNGVDLASIPRVTPEARCRWRRELGVEGRFVVSYIGTLGMAHRPDILLDAAELAARSGNPDDRRLTFLVAGAGSERDALERRLGERDPGNVLFQAKQPRKRALELLAASDASVIHLRASPLFTTVIPSKMFEAMALGCPILLGVDGEARDILEASNAGRCFTAEDPRALFREVCRLRDDRASYARYQAAGPRFVQEHFDRRVLARRYADILHAVVRKWEGP
jgi:glycosyltransferase involved in cell wall biosynthesis